MNSRQKCKGWNGKDLAMGCVNFATRGKLYCQSHRPGKYAFKYNYATVWCHWREEATSSEGVQYWIACSQVAVKDADYCEGHLFAAALEMAQLELPLEAEVSQ